MLNGEWESSKEVSKLMSNFIRKPKSFGKYKMADHDAYFCVSEFVDMDVINTTPTPGRLTANLAALNRDS
jgi:hypothetical protein